MFLLFLYKDNFIECIKRHRDIYGDDGSISRRRSNIFPDGGDGDGDGDEVDDDVDLDEEDGDEDEHAGISIGLRWMMVMKRTRMILISDVEFICCHRHSQSRTSEPHFVPEIRPWRPRPRPLCPLAPPAMHFRNFPTSIFAPFSSEILATRTTNRIDNIDDVTS